jgi:hypothetical protein
LEALRKEKTIFEIKEKGSNLFERVEVKQK